MNTRQNLWTVLLVALGLFGLLTAVGCGPKYPKCDTDEDCRKSDDGQESGRLYCVNGICQQCREDTDCGEGQRCSGGDCEAIEGWCDGDEMCADDEICKNNRCEVGCRSNDDCADDEVCKGGKCEAKVECTMDADCADGEKCRDNECVSADTANGTCSLETIYFSYDASSLSSEARNTLQSNADCIEQRSGDVQLAGHADERGTNEYNIALGERRARSAFNYLKDLGIPEDRLETISFGEERLARRCGEDGPESCHRQNRRVEFNWE